MIARRWAISLLVALGAVVLPGVEGAAMASKPLVLPTAEASFGAPYDAVWEAARGSLGVIALSVVDKAHGRIETEPFSFAFPAGGNATQVIWVSLRITVRSLDPQHTVVQVQARVHDALLADFMPGPTNNPWLDLFARIRSRLGIRE